MTIAVCYLSSEGVVFGADSTSTWNVPGSPHYFNHGQKLFEVGQDSTLGIVTWGLGALNTGSHRAMVAELADHLAKNAPTDVLDVANKWADRFWASYQSSMAAEIGLCKTLSAKAAHGSGTRNDRTDDEEKQFNLLIGSLGVGFCIGGNLPSDRMPNAFEILFEPLGNKPTPTALPRHSACVWGVPNMVHRLIRGTDSRLIPDLIKSGKWTGTTADIEAIINQYGLPHPHLPIRDAIDYVHMCISSTIKALKFSHFSQTCGGPIEIAVITADRPFRWVKHKAWDSAITDGEQNE